MSVKLEAPVYKTEVVKVSNMESVNELNDDSLFLVIQDGFAHKINAKTLKDSIYSFAQKQFDDFFKTAVIKQRESKKEFTELSGECTAAVDALDKSINRKFQMKTKENRQYIDDSICSLSAAFDNWKVEALSSVIASTDVVKSMFESCQNDTAVSISNYSENISLSVDQFKDDVSKKLIALSTEIEQHFKDNYDEIAENLTLNTNKIIVSNSNLLEDKIKSNCINTLNELNSLSVMISNLAENIQKKINSQNLEIQQHSQTDNSLLSCIEQNQQSIDNLRSAQLSSNQNLSSLSSNVSDLDKKLYGLTIEEVDENYSVVEHTILKGDIYSLSSDIQDLNSKYDKLLKILNELQEKIQ